MFSSGELVRFLMISDNQYLGQLTRQTLTDLCERLNVSAGMIHLTDGTAVVLKDEVNVPSKTRLSITVVPREADGAACAIQGTPIIESGLTCRLLCPSGAALEAAGFRSHACTPLTLMSTPIGALSALSRCPREFTATDTDYMLARGKRLVLALHHTVYFPDLGSEWLDLEQAQTEMHMRHRAQSKGVLHEHRTSSLIGRVLALQNLSRESPPSSLTRSLPKGINWPTLRRVCDYLEKHPGPISRKDLSDALGFSDITAGNYLTYLADCGVVRKEISYGQVGRPAFTYHLLNSPHVPATNDERPAYEASDPADDSDSNS